jgi:hypothetical protein
MTGSYGLQMFTILREQGRLHEVAPMLRAASALDVPGVWRPGLAMIYTELGMLDESRIVFDALVLDGFAAVSRDALWPACLVVSRRDMCRPRRPNRGGGDLPRTRPNGRLEHHGRFHCLPGTCRSSARLAGNVARQTGAGAVAL